MNASDIHSLPIHAIKLPDLLLRGVEDTTESFLLLMEDIRDHGIQQPIQVREVLLENGAKAYYLIEGRQRLGCAEKLGLQEVPVIVETIDETKAQLQMMRMNLHRSQPAPAAYAKFLKEILLRNNDITFKSLADEINQTPEWIRERLKLTDLNQEYSTMVDSGEINTLNGIALARLDPDDQAVFVQRAKDLPFAEFGKLVADRKKEVDKAAKACKPKPVEGFTSPPLLRPKADLTYLLSADNADPLISQIVNDSGAADVGSAVKATIAWIFQQDAPSIERRRTLWEAEQARQAEAKAEKDALNAAKREANEKQKLLDKEAKDAEAANRRVLGV